MHSDVYITQTFSSIMLPLIKFCIYKHLMTDKRIFFTLCEKPDYIFSSVSGNAGQQYFAVPHSLIRNSSYCLLHNVYDVSLENLVLDQLIIP